MNQLLYLSNPETIKIIEMIVVVVNVVVAIICASAAHSKGRSAGWWFFGGLVFGLFAIMGIAIASDLEEEARHYIKLERRIDHLEKLLKDKKIGFQEQGKLKDDSTRSKFVKSVKSVDEKSNDNSKNVWHSDSAPYWCGKCGYDGPYDDRCPHCGSTIKVFNNRNN